MSGRTCWCNICHGNGPKTSRFLIKQHIKKYGTTTSFTENSLDDSNTDGATANNSVYSCIWPVQDDDDVVLACSSDGEQEESTMGVATEEIRIVSDSNNRCSDDDIRSPVCSSSENSDTDFDEFGSSCTSDGEDETYADTIRPTRDYAIKHGVWDVAYDPNLYSSGLAVQKLNGSDLTVLQWLAMNLMVFSSHPSMSKSAFGDILKLEKHLQNEEALPSSYDEARKMVDPYLVRSVVFDVCSNDCVIYRDSTKNSFAELTDCPKCDKNRYFNKDVRRPISKRTFHYIPLGPRLARVYGNANLAQIVQSHPGSKNELLEKGNYMWDIHDSPTWKELYSEEGFFEGEKMGMSFALEVDGVNPFHNIGVMYSMTPIMLTILNLPRNIRNAFGNIMLVGIVKGQNRSEAKNLDPYIEILVDEMIYLSGTTVYSDYHKAPVQIKLKLLLYVLDYPGLSKLFHLHGSGSLAGCHWCFVRGKHCSHLDKVIYLSNRTYLNTADPIRQDSIHFQDKCPDLDPAPKPRLMEHERDYRTAFDNAKNVTQAGFVASATGCKGSYPILSMPSHNRLQECCPDACHTIKDVVQNIVHVLTGKSINTLKILNAEKSFGRLDISNCDNDTHASSLSTMSVDGQSRKRKGNVKSGPKSCNAKSNENVPFFLTKQEIQKADERAGQIKVPLGFGLKPSAFISKSGSLKSHDWKQLATQGILKYCLRGMLGAQQRHTLFLLLDCISDLCKESQCSDDLDELECRLNTALALLERDFPLTLQNITTHLMHHIVDGIRRFGPVYGTWMYVFERFNSWLCKRALNMRYPEASAIETYVIYDWCNFMVSTEKLDLGKLKSTGASTLADKLQFPDELVMEENASIADDRKTSTRRLVLKQRQLECLHKHGNITDCNNCIVEKYSHCAIVQHPIVNRVVKYSCTDGERASTKTISSCICYECDRGLPDQKLSSGKFLRIGQIKNFIVHKSGVNDVHFACISWFPNPQFDDESGLWFVQSILTEKSNYLPVDKLSPPLVTGMEEGYLWICNSGKYKYRA